MVNIVDCVNIVFSGREISLCSEKHPVSISWRWRQYFPSNCW